MTRLILCFALLCILPFPALADKAADRAKVLEMRDKTLQRLYKEEPNARSEIGESVGYAVFASGGVTAFFVSAAYGYGVAHDSSTGKDTYMEMAAGGVGIGLGAKDYRIVFIFNTAESYNNFLNKGLDLSGQADAAVKAGESGGELSEAKGVLPGVKVYQLTESGLALQATLHGTKYWKDDDLNY